MRDQHVERWRATCDVRGPEENRMPVRNSFVSLALSLVVALLGACAGANDPPLTDGVITPLAEQSGLEWRSVFRAETGLPSLLDAQPRPRAVQPSARLLEEGAARARDFLVAHRDLFGAAAEAANLEVRAVAPDPLGGARVRFAVRIGGLPVDGGDMLVALTASGDVRAVSGVVPRVDRLTGAPSVPSNAAATTAVNAVAAEHGGAELAVEGTPELIAFASGSAARPAWHVLVAGQSDDGPLRREIFVDAISGAIFHEREALLAARVRGSGIGVLGGRRELDVYRTTDGRYELRDDARGVRTYSAAGGTHAGRTPLESLAPDRWDEGVFGAGAAVDAHGNGGLVFDYLAATFHRSGLDGRGTAIHLVAHVGDRMANAFWDGHRVMIGDGDGESMMPLSAGLDIVAHELFHGVTESESRLVYEGQSGALNESLSDVFGCLVELERGDGNWTIGEAVARPALRDLEHPERMKDPAHMRDYVNLPNTPDYDMGGVHVNSTIPSHAAYLVAIGGAVPGIGVAKMRDIWWRAATMYLTPRSRFADLAEATRAAAQDLFGDGLEVDTVEAAWRAVGVNP
jgi:Zn-dependent metalloprotease